MLYFLLETQKHLLYPYAEYLNSYINYNNIYQKNFIKHPLQNFIQAKNQVLYEFLRNYQKPEFNFKPIEKEGITYNFNEIIINNDSFCELRFFNKTPENSLKKPLLIVAPLSGHYATLLTDTIKAALIDYDVYVTDWKNCRNVPLSEGDFGFDDYVLYVKKYIEQIKKQYGSVNVVAVCQPTVPVLCATALLEKENSPFYPDTVILMGGPVDTRNSPTGVNKYALKHNIDWFKNHVIHKVPIYFKGAGRSVYPGFLQYSGFIAMNFKKHTEAHMEFFDNLLKGADLSADKHRKFYEEYNSVMDLPAKYYLETLERVFLNQLLAKDEMIIANNKISLKDIKRVKILTIEGKLDDISGAQQTHATINLCSNLSVDLKRKETIEGVGHYGIFAGKKWRETIYPMIKNYIN